MLELEVLDPVFDKRKRPDSRNCIAYINLCLISRMDELFYGLILCSVPDEDFILFLST
jgi:hypothetical protein